jgi:hypothetical protein
MGMSFYLENPELLEEANKDIQEFAEKTKNTPVTLSIVQEVYGQEMVDQIATNQDYFDSLPDEQKKTYITVLKMVGEMDDTAKKVAAINFAMGGGAAQFKKASGGMTYSQAVSAMGQSGADSIAVNSYTNWSAERVTTTEQSNNNPTTKPTTKPADKKEAVDPYKDLLEKLKQIRNAAINAGGGVKEFLKVLKDGSATTTKFIGTDQKLLLAGYSTEFINTINGMDEETKKTFISIKNGIISVTDKGKALNKALSEIKLGDFQFSLLSGVAAANKQMAAMKELTGQGMSSADAFEIVQDESLAYAIATATTTEEVKKLVEDFKKLKKAQQELQFSTPQGTQDWLSKYSGALTNATSKVAEFFAAQRSIIDQDFMTGANKSGTNSGLLNITAMTKQIDEARNQVAEYQFTIDDLEYDLSSIVEKEDVINKKYDERAAALEKIWEANSDIAEQQKAQLSIADALASGDISAAARAIKEEQSRRAQKAREDQERALEKARENELLGVRSGGNKTRKQLEEEILALNKKIVEIEEKKLEPIERSVRLAENLRTIALEAVGTNGYLGKTEEGWRAIENAARLAVVQSEAFRESLKGLLRDIPGFSIDDKGNVSFDEAAFSAGIPKPNDAPVTSAPDTSAPSAPAAGAPGPGWTWDDDRGGWKPPASEEGTPSIVKPKGITPEQQAIVDKVLANRAAVTKDRTTTTASDKKKIAENIKLIGQLDAMGIDKSIYRLAKGGLIPKYFAAGGFARGTDTVPAMLTPGEFVMKRYAVDKYGVDTMKSINSGTYRGDSMYNYEVNVNVKSDANPDQIARAVMTQIKQIDSQRIRSNRY